MKETKISYVSLLSLFIFFVTITVRSDVNIFSLTIPASVYYLLILILLITYWVVFVKKVVLNDIIVLGLSIMIVSNTIIALVHSFRIDAIYIYIVPIVSLLSYLIFKHANISKIKIREIIKIIYIYICVQTIVSATIAQLSINISTFVKSSIVIPIGASNYIAAIVLILFIYVTQCKCNSKKEKYLLLLVGSITIFLTRSDGITALFFIYLIGSIIFNKEIRIEKRLILLVVFICTIILVFMYSQSDAILSIKRTFNIFLSGNFEYVFNGRFDLYRTAIELINEKFILGYGFNFTDFMPNNFLTHNIILDVMMQGGIMFLISNIALIVSVFFYGDNKIKNILLFALLSAQIEPSLMTFQYNIILFAIIGSILNKNNSRGVYNE